MTLARLASSYGLSVAGLYSLHKSQTFKVGRMLALLADIGDKMAMEHSVPRSIFTHEHLPRASIIVMYLQITSNAGLQDEQAILVLILIERLCHLNTVELHVVINSHSIFR